MIAVRWFCGFPPLSSVSPAIRMAFCRRGISLSSVLSAFFIESCFLFIGKLVPVVGVPGLPTKSVLVILETAGWKFINVQNESAVCLAVGSGSATTVKLTIGREWRRRDKAALPHGIAESGNYFLCIGWRETIIFDD